MPQRCKYFVQNMNTIEQSNALESGSFFPKRRAYVHTYLYMGVSLDPIGSERIAKMSNIIFYQKLVTPLNFS